MKRPDKAFFQFTSGVGDIGCAPLRIFEKKKNQTWRK
jgi:hypothetical protein